MKPMSPMPEAEAWWPKSLGEPSSSGAQNGMRYAFFEAARRLLIESHGVLKTYHTGHHVVSGVSQRGRVHGVPAFESQLGTIRLEDLESE
jgi:hypothetical protein